MQEEPILTRDSLRNLERLSDDHFSALVAALARAKTTPSLPELITALRREAPEVPLENAEHLVRVVIEAYTLSTGWRAQGEELAEFLLQEHDLGSSNSQHLKLRQRVATLLRNAGAVNLIAKSLDVWNQLPRRLRGVRILTDVRPIFEDGEVLRATGGLVVHTLRLDYEEAGANVVFHVTLDRDGLQLLDNELQRARQKEAALTPAVTLDILRTPESLK